MTFKTRTRPGLRSRLGNVYEGYVSAPAWVPNCSYIVATHIVVGEKPDPEYPGEGYSYVILCTPQRCDGWGKTWIVENHIFWHELSNPKAGNHIPKISFISLEEQ